MTPIKYSEAKEKLESNGPINPPIEQIVKYVNLMYKSLYEEWGFLCKNEILAKLVHDTAIIGLSRSQINQLLLWEE